VRLCDPQRSRRSALFNRKEAKGKIDLERTDDGDTLRVYPEILFVISRGWRSKIEAQAGRCFRGMCGDPCVGGEAGLEAGMRGMMDLASILTRWGLERGALVRNLAKEFLEG
jgi:hypothetical protein